MLKKRCNCGQLLDKRTRKHEENIATMAGQIVLKLAGVRLEHISQLTWVLLLKSWSSKVVEEHISSERSLELRSLLFVLLGLLLIFLGEKPAFSSRDRRSFLVLLLGGAGSDLVGSILAKLLALLACRND